MAVMSMAQTVTMLESGLSTRPAILKKAPLLAPLLGWTVGKSADLARTFRNPDGQTDARNFTRAMITFALGSATPALAFALMREWYDEELVGKKPNIQGFGENNNMLALMDRLTRVGTFGVAGDIANAIAGSGAQQREFSVDSRVFFFSSLMSVGRALGAAYRENGLAGPITPWQWNYASTMRPLMASLGGAGYLQSFDVINNLMEADNVERRYVHRINVSNLLRAAGREVGADVRTVRGSQTVASPTRPYVGEMVMAAYFNDSEGFKAAYTRALQEAAEEGKEDPYEAVSKMYQSMHPLRSVFGSLTDGDLRKVLGALGPKAGDVNAAISNFNAYGAQMPAGIGKPPARPFSTKSQPLRTARPAGYVSPYGDWRSLTTSLE